MYARNNRAVLTASSSHRQRGRAALKDGGMISTPCLIWNDNLAVHALSVVNVWSPSWRLVNGYRRHTTEADRRVRRGGA